MLSIVLAALVLSPFAGQSGIATYASIRGEVTTGWPNYKPVPNAQVVVSGDTDVRMTRTDARGHYTFLTLLPGIYHVYVPSIAGMTALVQPNKAHAEACLESANAPVELSAGLAYFANFDLVTHCA
jgi:Carboxypeptidase regulatory-like domain